MSVLFRGFQGWWGGVGKFPANADEGLGIPPVAPAVNDTQVNYHLQILTRIDQAVVY